ncbi:hypothetical protein BC751_2041 [Cecembia calidifontis]|uniref:Uncharacterized protein n=1 Tax=Cecembia calidifontis TaxID=1187080 RepID=A0A4V2F6I8_9BACT|nr:hypothetical protein BC751_2041 [Cecembia calidifontis]
MKDACFIIFVFILIKNFIPLLKLIIIKEIEKVSFINCSFLLKFPNSFDFSCLNKKSQSIQIDFCLVNKLDLSTYF